MYRWLEELVGGEIFREVDSHICSRPTYKETLLYERAVNVKLNRAIPRMCVVTPTPTYNSLCSSYPRTSEWPPHVVLMPMMRCFERRGWTVRWNLTVL